MDKLMQTLFYYIEDELLEAYGTQTDLLNQNSLRMAAEQRLRDTLNESRPHFWRTCSTRPLAQRRLRWKRCF